MANPQLAQDFLQQAFNDYQRGADASAIEKCRIALTHDNSRPDGWTLLGVLHRRTGQIEQAIAAYRQSITMAPQFADSYTNLGNALRHLRRYGEAIAVYRQALVMRPDWVDMGINLADALRENGQVEESLQAAQQVIDRDPGNPEAWLVLGNAAMELDRYDEAVRCYQQSVHLDPDNQRAYYNLGNAYRDLCRLDDSADSYRRALTLQPDFFRAHSNMLFTLQANPRYSVAALLAEHQLWERMHGATRRTAIQPHTNRPDRDKVLHIGYVSADFGRHPVGFFLLPVLPHCDRSRYKIFCYSNRGVEDYMTQRLRSHADVWRHIVGVSDEDLAQQIRADGIDILVDCSGHTQGNRLTLFAMKPAPVQATWGGYVGTTGLATMDYLITDPRSTPPEAEPFCVEKPLRLPDAYVCFAPPDYAPEVTPLPARRNGYVTFCCFNNLVKINPKVVSLWSNLLRQLPTARLLLITRQLGVAVLQQRYRRWFSQQGVMDRVIFRGAMQHHELLAQYGEVDIALDPFPYSGGLTTLECLWMGVPVITLGGDRFASRHSIAHMTNVGFTEGIVTDENSYLKLAIDWASRLDHLAAIRGSLRAKMAVSPACDGARFARHLEQAFRHMWSDWCQRQGH
ncbi:MAG: tetratricopeptide repeat protein [Magnetococcales bacterium]|nr:tetratricopeptide repeat protein [Magnetococcales bacterium]